mmetsp:Transcript_40351/g.101565  ORF Transcript_40351/g.101565 Transcript_40351/m.101565 type:complete len:293 (-) Transcript_40351:59-937(-)
MDTLPPVKALVFDVGGVFRFSDLAQQYSLVCALRDTYSARSLPTAWIEEALGGELSCEALWRLRGLETLNALDACVRLVIVRYSPVLDKVVTTKQGGNSIAEWLDEGDSPDVESRLRALIADYERCARERGYRDRYEELVAAVVSAYRTYFAGPKAGDLVRLAPHIDDALRRLSAAGYTLGLLSNSTEAAVRRDMGVHSEHFRFVVDRAGKPDPTVYQNTLRAVQLSPRECAYVGDACSDVVLARATGSVAVALLSGMGSRAQLERCAPDLLFESLAELVNHFCDRGRRKPQ